jgi:hypothetical protein
MKLLQLEVSSRKDHTIEATTGDAIVYKTLYPTERNSSNLLDWCALFVEANPEFVALTSEPFRRTIPQKLTSGPPGLFVRVDKPSFSHCFSTRVLHWNYDYSLTRRKVSLCL